jgi:hypothetical protein
MRGEAAPEADLEEEDEEPQQGQAAEAEGAEGQSLPGTVVSG